MIIERIIKEARTKEFKNIELGECFHNGGLNVFMKVAGSANNAVVLQNGHMVIFRPDERVTPVEAKVTVLR